MNGPQFLYVKRLAKKSTKKAYRQAAQDLRKIDSDISIDCVSAPHAEGAAEKIWAYRPNYGIPVGPGLQDQIAEIFDRHFGDRTY